MRKANGTRVTIAFDFDGVIARHAPCPPIENPNQPVEGALAFINWLLEQDYEVIIISSRARYTGGLLAIQEWLERHGFPKLLVSGEKVTADLYIDDRACRFDGSFTPLRMFMHNYPIPTRWEQR